MSKRVCVLIATHERLEITTTTIQCLFKQTVAPKIVLVVSKQSEFDFFTKKFPGIHITLEVNEPLGKKWQAGVDFARKLDISALVIQGSDDILCRHFIYATEQNMKRGVDFVGIQQWYITDPTTDNLYLFDYMPKDFPLGGGRYYSSQLLDKINWQIFDTSRNSCLDDKGWNAVRNNATSKLHTKPINTGFEILAVKGEWNVMNPLAVTMKHPNARLVKTFEGDNAKEILIDKFNYDPEGIL